MTSFEDPLELPCPHCDFKAPAPKDPFSRNEAKSVVRVMTDHLLEAHDNVGDVAYYWLAFAAAYDGDARARAAVQLYQATGAVELIAIEIGGLGGDDRWDDGDRTGDSVGDVGSDCDVPSYGCVPLCGAAKAYGRHVQWWHHELGCPARSAQREAEADARAGGMQ